MRWFKSAAALGSPRAFFFCGLFPDLAFFLAILEICACGFAFAYFYF
jgi:hypothetical protein